MNGMAVTALDLATDRVFLEHETGTTNIAGTSNRHKTKGSQRWVAKLAMMFWGKRCWVYALYRTAWTAQNNLSFFDRPTARA